MAPRPNWKGYLKLSLVSCPVALYPATTTSERVSFRTLNRATGNRLRRQLVDEQTGDVVEGEDQIKGYEVGKGEYIRVEDDEIKSVQLESNHTIDIEQFVHRSEVDQLYLDTPYYLAPTDRVGEEAFAVIRDAMRAEKMVGLARVVLFRRERIVMLEPRDKGITVTSLHYANEVHQAANYFDEIPNLDLPKQMLELATHIIEKMTGTFDPEKFDDRYENALIELIRSKQKGMPVKAQPVQRQTNVINLMDALRRSVEGAGAKGGAEHAAEKKAEKATPARKAEKTEKTTKARTPASKSRTRKAG
ncbi:MAG: Ku protein [Hyphomicrobiaceae bacterium]|nr:Ku protein [Hyphomicrobiaceae bacterium]